MLRARVIVARAYLLATDKEENMKAKSPPKVKFRPDPSDATKDFMILRADANLLYVNRMIAIDWTNGGYTYNWVRLDMAPYKKAARHAG